MAERRMFAKTIIDSDAFLDMPLSSQALYFHLSMRADDEGFINNPKKIQRVTGASEDDLKLLAAKSFIIPFESGVVVIKHWKMHNYIRSDRLKETVYQDEKSLLDTRKNGSYTISENLETIDDGHLSDSWQTVDGQLAGECPHRLGKVRLGKVSKDIHSPASSTEHDNKKELYKEIIDYLNKVNGSQYRHSTKATQKHISGRLGDGYKLEDFKTVIDKKVEEWKGTDMEKFLRPETLFGTKFEGYLNQKVVKQNKPNTNNKFNQFPQREYSKKDYAELEKKLLQRGL